MDGVSGGFLQIFDRYRMLGGSHPPFRWFLFVAGSSWVKLVRLHFKGRFSSRVMLLNSSGSVLALPWTWSLGEEGQ